MIRLVATSSRNAAARTWEEQLPYSCPDGVSAASEISNTSKTSETLDKDNSDILDTDEEDSNLYDAN